MEGSWVVDCNNQVVRGAWTGKSGAGCAVAKYDIIHLFNRTQLE